VNISARSLWWRGYGLDNSNRDSFPAGFSLRNF